MTLLLLVGDPAHVIRVSVLHIVTDCDLGHDEMPNVEVTVAARLYRAAFVWTAGFVQFPTAYETTNDQTFVPGEILAGEAVVTIF